jgi:hypothetical protein
LFLFHFKEYTIQLKFSNSGYSISFGDLDKRFRNKYFKVGKELSGYIYDKMMEFSKEKNNAISNQIGLYIALNIAAIGMIFFVSRSL